MELIIVACAVISLVAAGVVPKDTHSEITGYENINDGTGNYRFSFLTSNGIQRYENGRLENAGEQNEHIVVEGSYSYTDPGGNIVRIEYTADENGFHIRDTKPVPPAFGVPANVVASLLGK